MGPSRSSTSVMKNQNLKLKNSYYVLRHGESKANVQHLIVSDPENGKLEKYGLTERGKEQARQAATQLLQQLHEDQSKLVILTSCFSRAKETAEIVGERLQVSVVEEPLLRERYFGRWNITTDDHYALVWEADKNGQCDPTVESIQETLNRCLQVITTCEASSQGNTYLLVSHGDVLQIVRTYFAGIPIEQHRSLSYLGNGQIDALYILKDYQP